MRYRRASVPGASFFFTVVTAGRRPILASPETVSVLGDAFRHIKHKMPFTMEAVVVLPDHLHCIWTLPPDDADFPTRWRLIKTWFTKHCNPALRGKADASRQRRGEQAVWQHRYWEHCLRDDADFAAHVDYIHFNPVKHGYACRASEWPFSSMRDYIDRGVYSADWGCEPSQLEGVGHE